MKKIPLSVMAISSALCHGVYAGDMGPADLSDIWTGFYIGANAGGAWNKITATTSVARNGTYFVTTDPAQILIVGAQSGNTNTFIGGGQVGYNFQMSQFVLGLEADIDSFRINRSQSGSAFYLTQPASRFIINSSAATNWLFTLRPRIGYAMDSWLLYATGGLAVTNVNYNFQFIDNFVTGAREGASASQRAGWTAGAGLEVKLTPEWSVKGEYKYVDFGTVSTSGFVNTFRPAPLAILTHQAGLSSQIATLGINYKFS